MDILKKIYSKIGQRVEYLVLWKILNYLYIHKLKRYNKSITKIFIKLYLFYKELKIEIIIRYNLLDVIAIIIILNTLTSDFEISMTSIFEIGSNTIEEI